MAAGSRKVDAVEIKKKTVNETVKYKVSAVMGLYHNVLYTITTD